MGKAIKKKQLLEAEKELQFIKTLNDRQKVAKRTSKFKKQEKKTLLNLPEFILTNYLQINPIEKFKSNTHSVEKRAKDALSFMYGKYEINNLFLDLFYKNHCLYNAYKNGNQKDILNIIEYNREFFGHLVIKTGVGISTRYMLQKFLSKKEIAIFNTLFSSYGYTSIMEFFLFCKCQARGIEKGISDLIINKLKNEYNPAITGRNYYAWRNQHTTAEKFLNITEKVNFTVFEGVAKFIDFIDKWKERINPNIINDILDFLINRKFDFNYKGRTFNSLINCVIDWHIELNRQANERKAGEKNSFALPYRHGPFRDWLYTDCEAGTKFTCSQIRTYKKLCEEGRRQHHCLASYHTACANALCYIYTLRKYDFKQGEQILGTLEINQTGNVVQVRGLMNATLKGEALKTLNRWKKERKSYL